MIKGFILLQKKPELSDEAFSDHWLNVHGPLAKRLKTLRRYVQSHRLAQEIPGFSADSPVSGIAEIWMDSLQAIQSIPGDPDYLEGLHQDEPNFLLPGKTRYLATEQHFIISPPADDKCIKSIYLTRRKAGMSVSEFQDYWLGKHGPLVYDTPGLLGYTQAHVLDASYADDTPAYDGVAELWWPDKEAFFAAWNSPERMRAQAEDLPNFIDMETTVGMLVRPIALI